MAKRTARKTFKSLRKVSSTTFSAIKKGAKRQSLRQKDRGENDRAVTATGSLKGRETRTEERFRELAGWYMLRGMDEATAHQRARNEMPDHEHKS
jgi:hypothetical protein